MSYLLELLGRGLLGELSAAFTGLVLRDDGHYSTQELQRYVGSEPQDVEHHRRLGARLLADGQFTDARDRFLNGLRLDAANVPCRLGLACALDELGQSHQAVEHLQAVIEQHGDDPATWFALGFCLEKAGRVPAAVEAYERCVKTSPHLANAHERLAAIALKLDDVERAIAHYEHLCWCEPADLASNLTLANLYLRARRYEEAVRRFQFAVTIEPDNWEIQDDLVTAYIQSGRLEEAIEVLSGRIEEADGDADASGHLVRLGDLYVKTRDFHKALAAYSRASRINPDCLEAAIKVGTGYLRLGRYRRAAEAFAKAIEINDRIVTAYVGLGVAQMASGDRDDALATLELAGGIEPNSNLLFAEMARLQLKVTAARQAERYLSPRSVATHPAGPMTEDVAAVVNRQIDRFRTLLREHPTHADWHYRLGVLQRHASDLEGAVESFRAAVAINPNYAKALIKLGLSLRDLDETEAALNVLTRALVLDPESAHLHYELGLLFADRGQFAQAVERFEQALENDPHGAEILSNLALALQTMGLTDRAEATLRALLPAHDPAWTDEASPSVGADPVRRSSRTHE